MNATMKRLSRRRMLQGSGTVLMGLGLMGTTGFSQAQNLRENKQENQKENVMSENQIATKPTVVLVHGAFADSSGWTKRREMDKMEARKVNRRQRMMESLGLGTKRRDRIATKSSAAKARQVSADPTHGGREGISKPEAPPPPPPARKEPRF